MRLRALVPSILLVAGLAAEEPTVLKTDSADVHSAMSASSPVVKTLHRGEAVTVELSLADAGGAWCNIGIAGKSNFGWLRCDVLSTAAPDANPRWYRVEDAPPAAASAAQSPESPALLRAKKLCPEIDYSNLKHGWPLPQVAPSLELQRCLADAPGQKLTRAQIRLWQAEAERNGAQACWQRYLAIREKHHADEPGQGAGERVLAAEREWQQDRCYARIQGLSLRMLLGPLYQKLPEVYDKVMSGHEPRLH